VETFQVSKGFWDGIVPQTKARANEKLWKLLEHSKSKDERGIFYGRSWSSAWRGVGRSGQGFLWRLFILPIWSQIFVVAVLEGRHPAARSLAYVVTFVVAVLIWWAFIEGGRRAWAWWRTRD
jgi:hypothetical protein